MPPLYHKNSNVKKLFIDKKRATTKNSNFAVNSLFLLGKVVIWPRKVSNSGALAGFAFFVANELHQLRIAPLTGLGDFDEHGIKCSALWLKLKYFTSNTCHYRHS